MDELTLLKKILPLADLKRGNYKITFTPSPQSKAIFWVLIYSIKNEHES
jgi:hypothetical protein